MLKSQPYLIAAALITVYIILGILYESYILPITILSTLPSAGVGALLMLNFAGLDLSVIAMIGMILLIGIVKKNGIMMVDFAISRGTNARRGPASDAIRQACLLRFRPILMTTMAAMLSGLPLMLSSGAGSELRRPLGYAMVGGLALSQVLTLYTTPVIYLYCRSLQRLLSRRPAQMPTLAAQDRRRRGGLAVAKSDGITCGDDGSVGRIKQIPEGGGKSRDNNWLAVYGDVLNCRLLLDLHRFVDPRERIAVERVRTHDYGNGSRTRRGGEGLWSGPCLRGR